jgi:glycosyltransferase involved in cell wall biosynthesis
MDKIKVFLQYPWKSPDSSYYKNIIDFPPENIEFVNNTGDNQNKKFEVIGSSKEFENKRRLKNFLRNVLKFFKIPNLVYTPKGDYNLIHCAHCLSLNRKPWVMDTEIYDRVSSTGEISYSKFGKWIIRRRLESPHCKRIICWSEDCKRTFEEAFPGNQKILKKIDIVPFALENPRFKKISHKNIRILFVARWFEAKGGKQTLEIFDRLSKKNPEIEFIFICRTPQEFKNKYSDNKSIKIIDLMPQEDLFKKIYPSCDVFFYPGFGDSYGFAIPEALSYGLPVITSNTFAKSELIEDGKNGFLVEIPKDWNWTNYGDMDERLLSNFMDKTSRLIKNKKLRESMSQSAIRFAKDKFSIEKRNKKLSEIYYNSTKPN